MKKDFNKISRTMDEDGNVIYRNGKGQRHREDGPAFEGKDGTKEWWVNGQPHREDGPAYMEADGTGSWYRNGQPWPEGARAAKEKVKAEQEHRHRELDACRNGLPYDLEIGKPFRLKEKNCP